jgi:hypothetical protein
MPLSPHTLDALNEDYVRLRKEAAMAAAQWSRCREEAVTIARLLAAGGREVEPLGGAEMHAEDGSLGRAAMHAALQATAPVYDDDALDEAIMKHMARRAGGFKPSEMTNRLLKNGFSNKDGGLAGRVIDRLTALHNLGYLVREAPANRYRSFAIPTGTVQEEDGQGELA